MRKQRSFPWVVVLLLGPILEEETDALTLWRFHRRAARDGAGPHFSFIFRASRETAARVNSRIRVEGPGTVYVIGQNSGRPREER